VFVPAGGRTYVGLNSEQKTDEQTTHRLPLRRPMTSFSGIRKMRNARLPLQIFQLKCRFLIQSYIQCSLVETFTRWISRDNRWSNVSYCSLDV